MRKKETAFTAVVLAVLLAASTVIAAAGVSISDDKFAPLKNAKTVISVQQAQKFADLASGHRVGKNSDYYNESTGALIPTEKRYQQQIERRSDSRAKVTGGSATTNRDFIKSNLNDYGSDVLDSWMERMYFFNMNNEKNKSSRSIKVKYTNYRLFRPNASGTDGEYIPVDIVYTVEDWSKATKNWHKVGDGKPILGIGKNFDGLPCILMGNIANLKVSFTVYEAGTGTVLPNAPMSFTYGDIDTGQAISLKTKNTRGLVALTTSELRVAPNYKSEYHTVIGDTSLKNHHDVPNDSMGFYGDTDSSGKMVLIYTSDQIHHEKEGYPNATHSWFCVSRFSKGTFPMDPPVKRVYDGVPGDDVIKKTSEKYGTHDFVKGAARTSGSQFWYDITQEIPAGLDANSSCRYSSFWFTDELARYLVYDGFQVVIGSKDVTEYFRKTTDEQGKPIYKATSDAMKKNSAFQKLFCNGGKAGKIRLRINVHIKEGTTLAALKQVYPTNQAPQENRGFDYVDIPNTASTTFREAGDTIYRTQKTNTVKTRTGWTNRTDIVVRKDVTGGGSSTRRFTFTLTLENTEDAYPYTIARAGGQTEEGTIRKTMEFRLADDEQLTVSGVPENIRYTVKEAGASAFTPAYTVSPQGTGQPAAGSAGKGESLTAGCVTPRGVSGTQTVLFTNAYEPSGHPLTISKKTIPAGSDLFRYTVEFRRLAPDQTYTGTYSDGQAVRFTSDANGRAVQTVSLTNGKSVTFQNLPEGSMQYSITENAKEGYSPSYEVTEGAAAVTDASDSSGMGEGLWTGWQSFKPGSDLDLDDRYGVKYEFTNEKTYSHELTVTKRLTGTPEDPLEGTDTEFTFLVDFSDIPRIDGAYRSFTASILEDGITVKIIRSETLEEDHYTQTVRLKAGQMLRFPKIAGGTRYWITEKANDYAGSYIGTVTNGGAALRSPSGTGQKLSDLSTAVEQTGAGDGGRYDFVFSNERTDPPRTNTLEVTKFATDACEEAFWVRADLSGLGGNKAYAVVVPGVGSGSYKPVWDGNELYVDGSWSEEDGSFRARIAGIVFTVTRADGKQMTVRADENGTADLTEVRTWLGVTGGGASVSWAGGSFELPAAAADSGEKSAPERRAPLPEPEDAEEDRREDDVYDEGDEEEQPEGEPETDEAVSEDETPEMPEPEELGRNPEDEAEPGEPEEETVSAEKTGLVIRTAGQDRAPSVSMLAMDASRRPQGDSYREGEEMTGTVVMFTSDAAGNATVTFPVMHEQPALIEGLPEGTVYTVTELANPYRPSSVITRLQRNGELTTLQKEKKGETGTDHQTDPQTMEAQGVRDTVTFVNARNVYPLRIRKNVIGDGTEAFDFHVRLKGLSGERYEAFLPGEESYHISVGRNGDIRIESAGGNVSSLPVKVRRPSGDVKRMLTNASGMIPGSRYTGWVGKGQDGPYEFDIEWIGGRITVRFDADQ